MATVSSLTHIYRTESEIEESVSEGLSVGTLWRKEDYDWGIHAILQTIKKHRQVLGLPALGVESGPEEREKLMEREISEREMLDHMSLVRNEVGSLLTGASKQKRDVVTRLLNDLSAATGTNEKLGELFGKGEKAVLKAMQSRTSHPPTPEPAKEPVKKPRNDAEYESLLIHLRRAGKVQ